MRKRACKQNVHGILPIRSGFQRPHIFGQPHCCCLSYHVSSIILDNQNKNHSKCIVPSDSVNQPTIPTMLSEKEMIGVQRMSLLTQTKHPRSQFRVASERQGGQIQSGVFNSSLTSLLPTLSPAVTFPSSAPCSNKHPAKTIIPAPAQPCLLCSFLPSFFHICLSPPPSSDGKQVTAFSSPF